MKGFNPSRSRGEHFLDENTQIQRQILQPMKCKGIYPPYRLKPSLVETGIESEE